MGVACRHARLGMLKRDSIADVRTTLIDVTIRFRPDSRRPREFADPQRRAGCGLWERSYTDIKRVRPSEAAMMPTPRLAFISMVGTVAYLGLAVLGWGGFAAFFSHPALIAVAIATFAMSGVAVFSGANLSPGEREGRAKRWVLAVFAVIGVLAGYL